MSDDLTEDGYYCPELDFTRAPVLSEYMQTMDMPVECIIGPVGSGKSFATCTKLMRMAMDETIHPGGNMRYVRTAVIRNTTPELKSTTIKTWCELWKPEYCGPIVYSAPITQKMYVPPRDGEPGLYFEAMFVALDKPGDVAKLKSWDITNAWVNEASLVPMSLIRFLRRRLGRYPSKKRGIMPGGGHYQAKRPYLMMDANAFDEDNELYPYMMDPPPGWKFYVQPPAVLEVKEVA